MEARYLSPAEVALAEAIARFSERSARLANEFLDEVERAVENLLVCPESSPVLEAPLRRKVLRKLPYRVLYLAEGDEVVLVAVMSDSRESRSWADRF